MDHQSSRTTSRTCYAALERSELHGSQLKQTCVAFVQSQLFTTAMTSVWERNVCVAALLLDGGICRGQSENLAALLPPCTDYTPPIWPVLEQRSSSLLLTCLSTSSIGSTLMQDSVSSDLLSNHQTAKMFDIISKRTSHELLPDAFSSFSGLR